MDESRNGRVCVVGSINMDLVVRAPRLPAAGETLPGASFQQHPGGKGANQAVAARRLGASVQIIGAVGDDRYGTTILEALGRDGVGLERVQRCAGIATGIALITVDPSGENTIVVASGANCQLSPQHVERAALAIEAAAVTLAVLESPMDAVARADQIASKAGKLFVLNAAPATHLPEDLLAHVSVLIANQTEAALLADLAGHDPATIARALLARGPGAVIITLGAGGVLIDDRAHGMRRIPAIDVQPLDTVGAGDCFCGALAARLALGDDLDTAGRFACVAAGLATTRTGAIAGMPTLAEVEARLESKLRGPA